MEEIRVNEYVRTDMGICKIVKINKKDKLSLYVIDKCFPDYDLSFINLGMIKKHSPNIIDVIEYGDYVNGYEVDEFDDEGNLHLGFPIYDDGLMDCIIEYRPLDTVEIKSIVTHEQFETMKYKVEE